MSRGMSRHLGALVLMMGAGAAGSGACGSSDSTDVTIKNSGTCFDPMRFDAGPEPAGETQLEGLRLSITPFYRAERQQRMLERMRGYLEEETGVPVTATVSADYLDAVAALERGDLDIAQLSPYACVEAKARVKDAVFLASAIAQGTTTYASYLVVRTDSSITTLEEARGKALAFTDPWSTSGFLYPRALLVRRGFDPEKDFDVRFLGQHDRALAALLDGEVEVAAISSDTLVTHHVLGLAGPVRILAKAGRIPYDCIVARPDVGPKMLWRLRNALLTLSILTPRGRAVLADYNLINGFRPVPDDLYTGVAEVAALSKDAPRPKPVDPAEPAGSTKAKAAAKPAAPAKPTTP